MPFESMNCGDCRAKIDAYVDAELSGDELAAAEAHLRSCSSCAAEALARLQMKRMTQAAAAARFRPSPEFRLKIENSIQPKRAPALILGRTTFGWMSRLGVLAIALVLLAVGLTLWVRHSARENALAELVDLHVATLASANPVDVISTDRHTVKPWFQGKIPFTFNLPELQNSQFKLVGGRVAYFEHSPAAQLLFQIRSHQMSVFITQDRPGGIPLSIGVTDERELAFNVETWSDGGLRYIVVGDANSADIRALGDLMRGAK